MVSIQHITRYWHTLRYLRPVQLYGRVWFRLFHPKIDLRPAPPRRIIDTGQWVLPARRSASLVGAERFCFLNETRELSSHGWDDASLEKLWRYNLHYFDDLNAQDAATRSDWHNALLLRWVRENPPAVGSGWEPYPTSLRIVNWIKWALRNNELPPECIESLAVQVRWLAPRLEIHLLGNHLFANAKALVFAGLFFDGPEAAKWLEKGMRILAREVPEQILVDGGQFERSTMYHALALEDMLDLCYITTVFNSAIPAHWQATMTDWRACIESMYNWLAAMCHPDGEISLFNDAAIGIAPTPTELGRYARDLKLITSEHTLEGVTHLAQSGYVRVAQTEMVALLDVAPIGPDYLPGHAHADTLSFELSVFGERVLVNSGTSCYGLSAERLRQRETAAHNTVVVDDENSSEVWAGFRVARRARPIGLEIVRERGVKVVCSHNGYHRLPGQPVHTRKWQFGSASLVIEDCVSGRFCHAEARFHLHPSVTLEVLDDGTTGRLCLANGHKLTWQVKMGELVIEETTYHPCFGISKLSHCLVLRLRDGSSCIQFDWT
ncbi:heparinase II/III family protein [Nitrosomonas sp. Nm58]|uniref:heparinase II/III family protein n=1 Tax=Nitrosomonas sp. Nm58 TaxID=200126 RepID=UPI000B846B60|nr:heparinase II/III family protein [Nitrosomonas sp. Nm58]